MSLRVEVVTKNNANWRVGDAWSGSFLECYELVEDTDEGREVYFATYSRTEAFCLLWFCVVGTPDVHA